VIFGNRPDFIDHDDFAPNRTIAKNHRRENRKMITAQFILRAGATSVVGHSRPNWAVRAMSGLPPLATTERTSLEVGRSIDADAAAAGSGSVDSRRLVHRRPRLSSTPAARVRLDGKAAGRSTGDGDGSIAIR
jgi:hypothetical protein